MRQFARDHAALLVALFATSFATVRVLAISGWTTETAYVVLQTQATTSTIIGSLMPVAGVIAQIVGFLVFNSAFGHRSGADSDSAKAVMIAAAAVIVLGLAMTPIVSLILGFLGGLLGVLVTTWRLASRGGGSPEDIETTRDRLVSPLVLTFLTIGLLPGVIFSGPWLPRERFESSKPVVGWLLSEDAHHLVVLQDRPRVAVQLPAATDHHFCGRSNRDPDVVTPVPRWVLDPVPALLGDTAHPPACYGKTSKSAKQ